MSVTIKCCVTAKCMFRVTKEDYHVAIDEFSKHVQEIHRPIVEGQTTLELHCTAYKPAKVKRDGVQTG